MASSISRLTAIVTLAAGLTVFGHGSALALIEQQINFSIDTDPSDISDSDSDGDFIDNTGGPITSAISAGIAGTSDGIRYDASGSVGPFGNFGLSGALFGAPQLGPAEHRAQVYISSDEFVNLTGVTRNVVANFIIDGGFFDSTAGLGSNLSFLLTLSRDFSIIFQSGGDLTATSAGGGSTVFTPFGADIGAVQTGPTHVDIPVSFQSVDLGQLLPGETMRLEYQLDIIADIEDFAEGVFYEFSDPLDTSGSGNFPTIEFLAAAPSGVPEPNGFAALATGLFGMYFLRNRRRRRRVPA